MTSTSSTVHQNPMPPAATNIPQPVARMAYASDGKQLFIQGGYLDPKTPSFNAFALDLKSKWSVDNPAWTDIGIVNGFCGEAGVIVQGQFLATGVEGGGSFNQLYVYNSIIDTSHQWQRVSASKSLSALGQVIVTDPETGTVYFLGTGEGFFTTATQGWQLQTLPPPAQLVPRGHAASWSILEKGVVSTYVNTTDSGVDTTNVRMFSPQLGTTWTPLGAAASGSNNLTISSRTGHCFVPNESGSKYYLFGGTPGSDSGASTAALDDLYVFDLGTKSWTQLARSGATRSMMACAVAANTLVVWGGFIDGGNTVVADSRPLLFDFSSNSWVNSFAGTEPPASTTASFLPPLSGPGSEQRPSSTGSGTHAGAIAGGVVGGVAVIALVAGFFLLARRRRRRRGESGPPEQDDKLMMSSRSGFSSDKGGGGGGRAGGKVSNSSQGSAGMGAYTTIPSPFVSDEVYQQPQQYPQVGAPYNVPSSHTAMGLAPGTLPPLEHAEAVHLQHHSPPPIPARPTSTIHGRAQSQMSFASGMSQPPIIQSPFEADTDLTTSQHPLLYQQQHQPHLPPPPPQYQHQKLHVQQPASGALHSVSQPNPYHDRDRPFDQEGYGDMDMDQEDEQTTILSRSMGEPATVDLIPISASEMGEDESSMGQVSRSNSLLSSNRAPISGGAGAARPIGPARTKSRGQMSVKGVATAGHGGGGGAAGDENQRGLLDGTATDSRRNSTESLNYLDIQ
ncbi:hypothetical protein EDD11_003062 [Mortierella claussenii]|nr:hypothetical protein EDD11_003062 [Mortierella claussenii]